MEKLLLSGVNLDQCPAGLQQLNKLQILDLSENNISKLNSSTANLFKLRTLDLKGNKVKVRLVYEAAFTRFVYLLSNTRMCRFALRDRLFLVNGSVTYSITAPSSLLDLTPSLRRSFFCILLLEKYWGGRDTKGSWA